MAATLAKQRLVSSLHDQQLMADVKVSHRYDTSDCCQAPMHFFSCIPQGTIYCGGYVKACHDLVRACCDGCRLS